MVTSDEISGETPSAAAAPKPKTLPRAAFFGIAFFVAALDQAVKAWTRAALPERESMTIWPGVFLLTHTQNRGMAFSLLEGAIPLLAAAALLVIGIILIAQIKFGARMPRTLAISLALSLGGALGNLIDRLWRHSVTDLFDFRIINFPVFNVADAAITVGVVLLAWHSLTIREPERAMPAAAALSPSTNTAAEPPAA